MSRPISDTDDLRQAEQSMRPRSASFGPRPIKPGLGRDESRPPEVPTDGPFARRIPERTATATSAQGPSPPPPAEPVPGPAEPGLEEEAPQMPQEQQLRIDIDGILTQTFGSLTLDGCAHEQRNFILQHGMDMLSRGDGLDSVAQACAQMATLCQSNHIVALKLSQCTPEHQGCIIQHGMDMLSHGGDSRSVTTACRSMATLIRCRELDPLEQCTPEQQAYIIRHGMDMLSYGCDSNFVVQVSRFTAILCQSVSPQTLNFNDDALFINYDSAQQDCIKQYGENMLSNKHPLEFAAQVCASMMALIRARDLSPLEQCTPEQQDYIMQYGMDMIKDGNKPEWAAQVCASMAILYQNGIEQHIPDRIIIEANQSPDDITQSMADPNSVVFAQQFIVQRAVATKHLTDVMSANGANYDIMKNYLIQQGYFSWSETSCVMKYFLLQQRVNPTQDENTYHLECAGFVTLENLRDQYNEYFGLPDNLNENLLNQYTKTVAMYKAYTAIALRKTQFDGKDLNQQTCQLQRAMVRKKLIKSYKPAYEDVKEGETFAEMKGGIADSTALGPPVHFFTKPEYDIFEMKVPFFRILAIYIMSPELCCDDDFERKNDTKIGAAVAHEVVCDMHKTPLKLKRKATKST
jgi:hypothetical protein